MVVVEEEEEEEEEEDEDEEEDEEEDNDTNEDVTNFIEGTRKVLNQEMDIREQAEDWLSRTEGDEAAEERRVVVIVRRIRCTKMLLLVIPPELSWGLFFPNPIETQNPSNNQ
ncbi:hypothetical protein PPACK8108_LOCUS24083 [Phakopsora pachyrhizi]|uniref:Uncharacterized protein n=1 Tax=Phakopsora pachyrhizi TaxID=170000 RepID=A0AAV0BNZ7_PHAPC|nr:hypothetical protein PPACK8108_LOCUS24083 [Phakopsora pachyrhizi]